MGSEDVERSELLLVNAVLNLQPLQLRQLRLVRHRRVIHVVHEVVRPGRYPVPCRARAPTAAPSPPSAPPFRLWHRLPYLSMTSRLLGGALGSSGLSELLLMSNFAAAVPVHQRLLRLLGPRLSQPDLVCSRACLSNPTPAFARAFLCSSVSVSTPSEPSMRYSMSSPSMRR